MNVHITGRTAATALGDVSPMAFSGLSKIRADNLNGPRERVVIYEERVDGGYDVAKSGGEPLVLTDVNPSVTLVCLGNFKAVKTATSASVAVGYETQ